MAPCSIFLHFSACAVENHKIKLGYTLISLDIESIYKTYQ